MKIASVVSGVAFVKGVQAATGRVASHCTGLEARFMAQVAHAAEGLTRRQADPLVRQLEEKYQPAQAELRTGQPFVLLYDLESVQPKPHWLALYEQACQELRDLGLDLSNG